VGTAALVTFIADVVSRKNRVKLVYNLSQIIVCLSIGEAVLQLAGEQHALQAGAPLSPVWFPAFLAAVLIVYWVNHVLACTALSLQQGLRVARTLRSVGALTLSTDGVLLCSSPIFVAVGERSIILVPLLLLNTWVLYKTAKVAGLRQHEATHDPLTRLPNRKLFEEHLRTAILSAERVRERLAVVMIDFNGFKDVNDRFGHDYGDEVLRQVAARMDGARRTSDLLARVGGDEFAVVLTDVGTINDAQAVVERMQTSLSYPCTVNGLSLQMDASFGLAIMPDDGRDEDALMQRADHAMYSAKRASHAVAK
jgi:diguanylate cyclase (GGDEF)-like protein